MGYYHDTYLLFGAEVETEEPYRTAHLVLDLEPAQAILKKYSVNYSLDGEANHQFLFLHTKHYSLEVGEYRCVDREEEQFQRDRVKQCAKELGMQLNQEPTWIVVRDYS